MLDVLIYAERSLYLPLLFIFSPTDCMLPHEILLVEKKKKKDSGKHHDSVKYLSAGMSPSGTP